MNGFELLKLLTSHISDYEAAQHDKNSLTINGLVEFLHSTSNLSTLKSSVIGDPAEGFERTHHHIDDNIERIISQHLILLNRYIKFYAKSAFENSNINTLEEFSMLMTVMQHVSITKTELIKRNIIEKSSGIEIINRLIKLQLLTQSANPADLRSHLISLTERGKMELYGIFMRMDMLGHIATGELTAHEKQFLATTLKKLDDFHSSNYNDKRLQQLEDYLPKT